MANYSNPDLLEMLRRRQSLGAGRPMPMLLRTMLLALAVSVFMSDSRVVPGLRNNVGAFEVTSMILVVITVIYAYKNRLLLRQHPLVLIIGAWFVLAIISLVRLPPERLSASSSFFVLSATQSVVFLFQFVFVLVLYNLMTYGRQHLVFLFRCLALASLIVGVWVLIEQITTGSYNADGPFRGRSHMGIYMMGAFWLLLIYRFWPGVSSAEKQTLLPLLALVLFCVAASLRQSVYVAMVVGVSALVLGSLFLGSGERFKPVWLVALLILPTVAFLFFVGDRYIGQLAFFQREFGGLANRLDELSASPDEPRDAMSFDVLQRNGAFRAFSENPVLGIGWQGFYRSEYSPTGHELHSTPLRFMAEMGLLGLSLYLLFLGILFFRAIRLFLLVRRTPYQLSAMIVLIALISTAVSHYYNRMFTDRPYWILLAVFLAFETIVLEQTDQKATVADGPHVLVPVRS